MKNSANNILIVDDDLGFILWLGRALVAANHQPWPACSVRDATILVGTPTAAVDLLIINSAMPGAPELIALLRRAQSRLRVIALGDKREVNLPHIDAWRSKPERRDTAEEQQWIDAVKRLVVRRRPVAA